MIKDRLLRICTPPAGWGAPFSGRLTVRATHLYGELTVYHTRFWEAVQAGTRISKMVQISLHPLADYANAYAILADGNLYRVEEAQLTTDPDGLPVTNLSLRRMEDNYELCAPEV